MASVPLSKDNFRTWWIGFFDNLGVICAVNLWILCGIRAILAKFGGDFYGMKRARVGAFTDFGGSRYRNPVHFLGTFPIFGLISGFSGLV